MKASNRERRRCAGTVAVAVLLALGTTASQAATIHISTTGNDANDGLTWPTAKATVQAGLNAAGAGDEVWVAAGTYVGCITLKAEVALYGGFVGGETDLSQRDWVANETILDGNQAGSVVTAPEGAGPNTRIDGFVIRNGIGTLVSPVRFGGGIYFRSSSPTIINNTITGNMTGDGTAGAGGGIYFDGGSATISGNKITDNVASSGGGVYWDSDDTPTVTGNTIVGNIAANLGGGILCRGSGTVGGNTIAGNRAAVYGGGVCCSGTSAITIERNAIVGNSAEGGGGICCFVSSPTIVSNVISGNSVTGEGGGIRCAGSSSLIANNTITKNTAPTYGGGLWSGGSSYPPPVVVNTIIAFNSSGIRNSDAAPVMRNSCVYGNDAYNYSGMPDPTGSDGNISVDPKLADVSSGNVHIQPDSPCVNTGDDSVVQAPWLDMDGQARKQGEHVDVGADESDGTAWPAGPSTIVRVSPTGSDANDGSSWSLAKRSVQAAANAACRRSGEVWVQAGTYHERVLLLPFAPIYGGFAGSETQRSKRDWSRYVTILDGDHDGSVVTAIGMPAGLCTIDGFTIRNGTGTPSGASLFGGGIYCSYASPAVVHCTVTGNAATAGGGIYGTYSSPSVTDSVIVGNSATSTGGGIYCSYGSPVITNSTLACNTAGAGGGIFCASSPATVRDTIVAFNTSGIRKSGTAAPLLAYNCFFGNTAYNYAGLTDPTGLDGNIAADPSFLEMPGAGADGVWGTQDDAGDLRLVADSPCRNTGDPAFVPAAGQTDLDGYPRLMADRVDMGAYEFTWVGDVNLDGYVDVVDLLSVVYAFGTASGDPGYDARCDFNGDGAVDVADLLDLVYNFGK